jgi:hypothetical protein
MASTFVNNLRLEEMATGEQSGNWGTKTNTNLELIGEALGFGTESITTNANTHTTTVADASSDAGRAMFIKYTGALDSDCTITIGPNTMKRVHIIENATTDSGSSGPYNIIVSQGSGANITIPNGTAKVVYLDGAGSGAAVVDAFAHLSVVALTTGGRLVVDDTTEATSTTDGSLQTDGGLSVAKDVVIGDDLKLLSDSSVLSLGAGSDATLTHDGTTGVTLGANPITLDSGGDITLDTAGNEVRLKVSGTEYASLRNDSSDFLIRSAISDKDIKIQGNDGGSFINALTFDMSDAGRATFNNDVVVGVDLEITNDVEVTGRSVGVTVTAENDGSFDLAVGNDFTCTTSGNTEITFSNAKAGQSGNIKFVNASNHTITANALVAINADVLTTISASGTYHLAYYVTADSGNDTILVSASAALT